MNFLKQTCSFLLLISNIPMVLAAIWLYNDGPDWFTLQDANFKRFVCVFLILFYGFVTCNMSGVWKDEQD